MTLQVRITQERWQLNEAFEIAGQVMTDLPLLLLELIDENGNMGRAERSERRCVATRVINRALLPPPSVKHQKRRVVSSTIGKDL